MTVNSDDMRARYFSEYRQIVSSSGLSSTILDSCHDSVLLIEDGIVIFANRALLALTGYSADEAIGLPFDTFLAPAFIQPAVENYKNRLAGLEAPGRYKVGITAKDGTISECEVNAGIIEHEGRKIDLVILRDYSERTRYEKSIEERDRFLDSIIEQSPNPMWISDKDGNIVRINQALRDSLLVTDEDVIGIYNVFNDVQVKEQGFLDLVTSVFIEGKTVQFTIDYYTAKEPGLHIKTGTHRIIDIVMAPVFTEDNKITNVVCMQKDITNQKIAEQSMLESERKYHSIFDNSFDAILLTATDGRIIAANAAACKLFGRTEEELMEGGRDLVVDTEDPRVDYFLYERKQKGSAQGEMTLLHKDGTRFEAEITSTEFTDAAETELTVMVIRDITERNRLEQSLESTNRTLRIVSECNQALIRSTEESELLEDICRIVTDSGGYLLAWVGFKQENENKLVIPSAYHGSGKEYIDGLEVSWADTQLGSGPTGSALRDGVYSLVSNVSSDPRFQPWKERALEFGFHSALAFPLLDFNNEVFGAITIYAGKGNTFTDEEIVLLNELAGDLAYGIISLRTRKEQEKAGSTLRENEKRLQDVLLSQRIGTHEYDVQTGLVSWDDAVYEIFERDRTLDPPQTGETTGYYTPEQEKLLYDLGARVLKTKEEVEYTLDIHMPDGRIKNLWSMLRPVIDEKGNVTKLFGLIQDITSIVTTEQSIRLFNFALKSIHDCVYALDEEFRIIYWNEQCESTYGIKAIDAIGKLIGECIEMEEFYPGQNVERIQTLLNNQFNREEQRIITPNGVLWMDILTQAIIDRGISYGWVTIATDITENKLSEEALRQSEEKLRAIIESIPQGIIVTNLEGNIVQANPSAVAMFGFNELEKILGRNALEFALPDYHEIILNSIRAAKDSSKPLFFEYIAVKNNGNTFPASMSVAYIRNTEGEPAAIVGLFEDITERLKMQEQLVVTDRLASIGELAAGIAHELNNPLTGVIGFSDLILERTDIPPGVREDLVVINQEALRASQVARHLLTFARKHPDQKSDVDVNEILRVILELRSYDQNISNISVISDLQPDIPKVTANEFQLQQVFLNIVINAEYFMKESHDKGKLIITTLHIGNNVRIVIEDDGPGIRPDHLNTIFNPFFTTKDVGKGTGLGLSISYGIISEHSGTIRAENRDTGGARFIIELPVSKNDEAKDQSTE